jgi:ribosome-associated protein
MGDEGRPVLRVSRSLSIPLSEFDWRFSTSGGPGGQHANRASTRAEVIFDIVGSPSLGPRQRERLLARFGPTVRVAASDDRSQTRNRDIALERLGERLAQALRTDPLRRPTKPTMGSRVRRVDAKRRQGARKRERTAGRDTSEE